MYLQICVLVYFLGMSLFCFCFPTYFSFQQFFYSLPILLNILLKFFSILLTIRKINCSIFSLQACVTALLEYFVHSDCSIRVSQSLVTISYEHMLS